MEFDLSDFKNFQDIQIRFNDVDGFCHINNSIMQEYFDLGRMDYFIKVLKLNFRNINEQTLVVVSTKTDFIRPLYLGDRLKVYTKVYQLGNKSLKMLQWLVKGNDDSPSVVCYSVMAGFVPSSETSMEIPETWRIALIEFEKNILLNK